MPKYYILYLLLTIISIDLNSEPVYQANLIIGYNNSADQSSIVELEKKFSLIRVNFIDLINAGFYSTYDDLEQLRNLLEKENITQYTELPAEKSRTSSLRLIDQYYLSNFGQTINGKPGDAGKDLNWIKANLYFSKKSNNSDVVTAVIDDGLYWFGEDEEFDADNLAFNSLELSNSTDNIDNDSNGYVDDYLGWDFYDNDPSVSPGYLTHGTKVASLIAAKEDSKGITGIAKNTKILPLKVFGDNGNSSFNAYLEALQYAYNGNVDIINISLSGGYSIAEKLMFDLLEDKGILVVCSAGNYGNNNDDSDSSVYPASYSNNNIISVTSIDQKGSFVETHNYGQTSVDIAAPGEDILVYQGLETSGDLYIIDFENDPNWGFGFATDNQATDGWIIDTEVSETTSWMRSSSGYYQSNTESYVVTNQYNLYAAINPSLELLIAYDLEENYDFLYIDITTDGLNYTNLATITGNMESFSYLDYSLNEFLDQTVRFRFRLSSDNTVNKFGVTVGSLKIKADTAPYVFAGGTSFSAPIVSGLCSLIKSINRNLSATDIKDIIMRTAIPSDALSNKTVSGGYIDIFNSLYAINNKQKIQYSYNLNDWLLAEDFFSNELIPYELNDYEDFKITMGYQINEQNLSENIISLTLNGRHKLYNFRSNIVTRNIPSTSEKFFVKSEEY